MKRYRIVNARRFTSFLTVMLLLIIFIAGTALGMFDASSKDKITYTTVQVQAGDTLWQLAKTYGPEKQDIRMTVYQICQLNNVSAETLMAGQYITIPN